METTLTIGQAIMALWILIPVFVGFGYMCIGYIRDTIYGVRNTYYMVDKFFILAFAWLFLPLFLLVPVASFCGILISIKSILVYLGVL